MRDKSILNKIEKLEKQFPFIDIEERKKHIYELVDFLESYFEYSIKERFDFSIFDDKNLYDPERTLFEYLTMEELKMLAYDIKHNKEEKHKYD